MYEILMSLAVLILFVETFIFEFEIRKLKFKLNKIISEQSNKVTNVTINNSHEVGKAIKDILERSNYRK